MTYNYITLKNFIGLYVQANSFALPDGALEQADNCVIAENGVIKKRRGFSAFNVPTGTPNALFMYQSSLMSCQSNKISALSAIGVATDLTGATVNTVGLSSRSAQANGNLYFTSQNGTMKIESPSSKVYTAGVPQALDLQASFTGTAGIISSDTQVGYRTIFIRRDLNKNLLVSSPSEVAVLTNSATAQNVTAAAAALVITVTSTAHGLSSGDAITVSNALSSGTSPTPIANVNSAAGSSYFVTVTGVNSFTFTVTAPPTGGTLATINWGTPRNVNLEFSIPSEIASTEFSYQIYRSSQSLSATTAPLANYKLVYEGVLTASQLSAGIVRFFDNYNDLFLGAELYTNPNSRDGELQAAERPPLAQDICSYKNQVLLSNITSRHRLSFALGSTNSSIIAAGAIISVNLTGGVTRTYIARGGVGNSKVAATSSAAGTTLTVTSTAHGFANGDTIYVSESNDSVNCPDGTYTVAGVAANTFTITTPSVSTATTLNIQGLANVSGNRLFTLTGPTPSVSVGIQSTAKALCKAINRDSSSPVYARYTSGATDVPGQMALVSKGFGLQFYLTAATATIGSAFVPALPTSGATVGSDNSVLPNALYCSKLGEPEAFPLLNYILVGSKNYRIIRVVPLRDSVIVIKEDGIFRVNGDTFSQFASVPLDTTVFCLADNSVAVLNNQVLCLSNQGVVMISESSVQIVSRSIESLLTAINGQSTLNAQTYGVSYESDRLYILSTLAPNTTTASTVYIYNSVTNAWTTWDTVHVGGIVGPNNTLFYINSLGTIFQERKLQNKLDYAGSSFPSTVVSVATDKLSAVINTNLVQANVGDIFVWNNVISRVSAATSVSLGTNITVTFKSPTNLLATNTPLFYQAFKSTIKLAPVTAGDVGRNKAFQTIQAHFRNQSCSRLTLYFSNEKFGSSESIVWQTTAPAAGWGNSPWSLFGWGQEEGLALLFQTLPTQPVRTYVPKFACRGTFLQPTIEHNEAGEQINLQALAFAVRGYGERITK